MDATRKLLEIYRKLLDRFGPQSWWPGETPFEVAVGAILTQNTSWQNVERAIGNIRRARRLSFKGLYGLDAKGLAALIRPAGYFNVKAKRLRNFLVFLKEDYAGSLKKMAGQPAGTLREQLLSVNGIGPETADSILLYALGKPVFVVDAYTRRIFSRHGLAAADAAYDDLQRLFSGRLKPDGRLFNEYHALIVRLGKDFCKKTKPLCHQCPLHEKH